MIRAAVIGLALVTAAVLQTALFPHLPLAGYRPDLLLLVSAVFALRDGPVTGVAVAFAAGLLADLLLVQPAIGLTAAVYVAVAYAVGVVRPYIAHGSVAASTAVAFVTGLVATAGYAVLSRLLGDPRYGVTLIVQGSLAVALYNTLVSPAAVALVDRLSDRFPPERTAPL